MKIVVFSDAHADAFTAGLDRFADVADACWAVVRAAISERADLVLFLGDLTDPDTSRSHRAVALMAAIAFELRREGIEWRGISGNHDAVEDGSGSTTLSPLKAAGFGCHFEPAIETVRGIEIVFLPYPPRSRSFDPQAFVHGLSLSSMRGKRFGAPVVAGHLMIRGADPGSESAELARGRDVFWPIQALREQLSPGALLLGGHYHRRQVVEGVQIPGSLARLRFDEEYNAPGFLVCELPKRAAAWRVRHEPIRPSRFLITIHSTSDVWGGESLTCEAKNGLRADAPGAIARVRPPADAPADRIAEVVRTLEQGGAVKVVVEPRPSATIVTPGDNRSRDKRSAREVVMAMAAEARTADRPALERRLDEELSAQKL